MTTTRIGVPEPPATPAEIQMSEMNVAMIAQTSERCVDQALGGATRRAVGAGRFWADEDLSLVASRVFSWVAAGGIGCGSGWVMEARSSCLLIPASESGFTQEV